MPEDKKRSGVKVCGWLSDEVFSKLNKLGYKSPTVIVRHGAELIIGQPIGEHGELIQGTIEHNKENSKEHIENIREQAENIGELRAHVREQKEHIETLKLELERAAHDKEDLKAVYINYFNQVQGLINQKAIEAPGEKKNKWWKRW